MASRRSDTGNETSDGSRSPKKTNGLNPRKAAILNAVVAEYVETAQPVGSAHVTGSPGVEVSSATVRSEMAALENEGYLVQPHTSAGRIPTDKGYRFFVDHLARPGVLDSRRRQEVRRFFEHVHGEVEELLSKTSGLLAHLTDYAAVVVGPGHGTATIRSVQLVGLSSRLALLVAVLSDGAVEKATLDFDSDVSETALSHLAAHLTFHLRDRTFERLGSVPATGDSVADQILGTAVDRLSNMSTSSEPERVFVGGSSSMASAFDAFDTVRSVLSILEQQLVVVGLIEDVLDRGLSVAIGTEHGFEPLASCALVVAPLSVDGEVAGTIGVLGPTRMRYPRALAAVQMVGEKLSTHLSTGTASAEGVTYSFPGSFAGPEPEVATPTPRSRSVPVKARNNATNRATNMDTTKHDEEPDHEHKHRSRPRSARSSKSRGDPSSTIRDATPPVRGGGNAGC